MQKAGTSHLTREAIIVVVFAYVLLVGGTLNGLALYEAINLSLGLMGLVGAAWLGWAWWRKQAIAFSPVTAVYGVYLAAYAVATALSSDPRRSLNALWLTTLYALVWVLVSDLIRKGWPPGLFTRVMVTLATGVIGLALWQTARYELDWLALNGGKPLIPPIILRPTPLLTHANMVAAFLNLLYPIALIGLLNGRSWLQRVVVGLWILLAWAVILLCSSRGAWLGAITALPVTVGLWWLADEQVPNLKSQIKFVTAGWLAIGGVILILVAGGAVVAARLLQSPTHGAGISSRQEFWEAAWETFVAHPMTGLGPDTFATAYLRHISIPPFELFVRAHSQPMHVLAENGLLGILVGGVLLVAIGWAGWRHWLTATVTERRLLAGIVGALSATIVHSFFDTPPAVPVNALVIATLTAILTTLPPPRPSPEIRGGSQARREGDQRQHHAGWWRLALTMLLLALVAVGAWTQSAYRPYLNGTALANSGNWKAAAPELETAVARDPNHALYDLASGYVHGVLASQGDASALPIAIRRYQAAIAREPGYGLNYANLAALYWQQGNIAAAEAIMARAVQAAPREATFWLNLGLIREKTGDLAGAREAYAQALTLRPLWAEAYHWRANDLRRSVLDQWRVAHPPPEPQSAGAKAEAALTAGRYDEALLLYNQALTAEPQLAPAYLGRALALMELGRYQEATRDARAAAFIGGLEADTVAWPNWVLAQIAYRQGDLDIALTLGEQALDAFRRQSIFGPGTYGASLYGWAIFYRMGLTADMLPQLETIRFTNQQVTWLKTTGNWYEQAGDTASARRIYQEALAAAPDAAWAEQRLKELTEP